MCGPRRNGIGFYKRYSQSAFGRNNEGDAVVVGNAELVHGLAFGGTPANFSHCQSDALADDPDGLGIQLILIDEQAELGCNCCLLKLVELADPTARKALPIVAAVPCLKMFEARCRVDYLTPVR